MPNSLSTSSSLLALVKARDPDGWTQFVRLYGPIVYSWARSSGLQPSDASDALQNTLVAIERNIDRFRRDHPSDSFRNWLATITRSKIRDHYRRCGRQLPVTRNSDAQEQISQAPDRAPSSSDCSNTRDHETCRLVHDAADLIRGRVEPRTWEVFWRIVVEGHDPSDVAGDFGMKIGTVYVYKSRVLSQLRDLLEGLLDDM